MICSSTNKSKYYVLYLPKDKMYVYKVQLNTITFDNFKNGLTINNAKKQIKRVKGGVIIDNIPFTIKVKENNVITNGGDL